MLTLSIAELLSSDIRSRSNGDKIRRSISDAREVTLDFTNVRFISRSFADELYNIVSEIGDGVRICAMNKDVDAMYNLVSKSRQKKREFKNDGGEILRFEDPNELFAFLKSC